MSANSFSGLDENPFNDPSVTHLAPQTDTNQPSLEGYNPFDSSQAGNKDTATFPTQNAPPDVTAHTQPISHHGDVSGPPPPAYNPSAAQNMAADLQRRQEELEKKARELQTREENLANSTSSTNVRQKNWPPLPKRCCIGPCFYQDITIEIPDSFQQTVRTMYYMWLFYAFLLFLNMLGALALFITNDDGTTFGLSILVSVFFTPLSFVCWYRPLYKAFRSDSSFNFMVFFFVFFFQFVVAVFYAVGIPNLGSCGLLNGITTLNSSSSHIGSTYTVGIIAVFIGFLWVIHAMVSFYMLVKIHRIYRSTGASFAKAQEEFASGVMRNPHVQTAATNVVSNAAQEVVNRNVSGLRY